MAVARGQIQDYLGHKAIQHAVRYTELIPTKFKDFSVGLEPDPTTVRRLNVCFRGDSDIVLLC